MTTAGSDHSQSSYGDCVWGIRRETVCPPLPRSTLRTDKTGARTSDDDHQRGGGTAGGDKFVTQPAVHSMPADVQSTQHFVTSQASQRSPSDDFHREPSEGRDAVMITMEEGLSTSQSFWAGDAMEHVYAPGDSDSQRIEPGRHVTVKYTKSTQSHDIRIRTNSD